MLSQHQSLNFELITIFISKNKERTTFVIIEGKGQTKAGRLFACAYLSISGSCKVHKQVHTADCCAPFAYRLSAEQKEKPSVKKPLPSEKAALLIEASLSL